MNVAAAAAELRRLAGDAAVLDDPAVLAGHGRDWTGRWEATPALAVRPAGTADLAAVIAWCAAEGVAVVPQGGNTGLVGGSVALDGEVLVLTSRLRGVTDVDPVAGQLTAGAGTTVAEVAAAAREAGWTYAVDFAARDSATIGGTVATNAGGLHVLRHGATRRQVLGVEAVLGDGATVSHLGGLVKDNTGYDLAGLLCGSEGTLGIVTAARLGLVPATPERAVALVALPSIGEAVALAGTLRATVGDLAALEFFTDACRRLTGAPALVGPAGAYLLAEAATVAGADPVGALAPVLASLDAVVAGPGDPAGRARIWAMREGITEAINRVGTPVKLDVTLPAGELARFCEDVPTVLPPGADVWLFGHLGDGNVHVNVTGVEVGDGAVDDAVLSLVAERGGSISAEHGIGRAKRRWLHLVRSDAELRAMRAIKAALDPSGILNPAVLLP